MNRGLYVFVLAAFSGVLLFVGCLHKNLNEQLLTAAANGDAALVERLLQEGADVNYVGNSGNKFTPLLWACFARKLEVAMLLLKQGADPNIKSSTGYLPLFYAVGSSEANADLVSLLLEKGADPAPLQQYSNIDDLHPRIKELIKEYQKKAANSK